MWLILVLLNFITYSTADIFAKKSISRGNECTTMELMVTSSILSFVLSIIMYISGLGESGLAPWTLIIQNPILVVNAFLNTFYYILFFVSMKFIGLSIQEALSGGEGILYFLGMVIINLTTGKLSTIQDVLRPIHLIPIICILICMVIYANAKPDGNIFSELLKLKQQRRHTVIGFLLLIASMTFDSADSIITTIILDDNKIGTCDYTMSISFIHIIPLILFTIIVRIKNGKFYIPFKRTNFNHTIYAVSAFSSSFIYIMASSLNAVGTGIAFIIYPIVPILCAKIFLKEKQTIIQNTCIWVIVVATIVFCIGDYV